MRSTVTIDDELLARVRQRAASSGRTVEQVIEDSVRRELARDESAARPFRVRAFHGGAVRAGVDLDDGSSLLETLDER